MPSKALAPVDQRAIGRFTPEQYDIITNTICAGGTKEQVGLFIAVCNRTGLDPFAKQIYAVIRKTKNGPQMAIQVGIDGYRLIAERSRDYAGQDAPEWCDEEGHWTDVWLDDNKPPAAARVRVYRNGHQVPTVGVAKYKEFVQYENEWGQENGRNVIVGRKPTAMWRDMPANQLAKCAESQALRRAFPNDLADISTDFEFEAEARDVTPAEAKVSIAKPPIQQPQRRKDVDEQGEMIEPPPPDPEPDYETVEGEVFTAAEAEAEAPPKPHGQEFVKGAEDVAKAMGKSLKDVAGILKINATPKALIAWANEQGPGALGKLVEEIGQGELNG